MIVAIWILSILLIAEFVMAPINLWTGRTMPLFRRFTGFEPVVAQRVFAPVKLVSAVLVAVGIAVPVVGLVGAVIVTGVCSVYLVRLAAPGRRDRSGIAGFGLFGAWAVALLVLQLLRIG
ncbi:MAG TPA: hypothetical protein VJ914_01490 [Pseudonocardiaceae bacterium]|nr:hypothetical protein [Pseudonocardiaceae bacterium]